MDTKQEIARAIRAARVERGFTQADLARALGLHRPAISEIEAGRRSVTSEEIVDLARVLAIPVADLLPSSLAPETVAGAPVRVEDTIRQMVRVIVEQFAPQRVILFGSHGRGTAGPDSDVDLLVVIDVQDSRRRTGARIGAAVHEFEVAKDIIVTTPEAFSRRRHIPGTIEQAATAEGTVLHGT